MGYNEDYNAALKKENQAVDDELKKRKESDAAQKAQIGATLDTAADAAAGVYRQKIEDAPLESRALYDQNAMREAVDRKKIEESLANMGMTDSGVSSSMQTALAVQKSRADSSVRAAEQQRIRAAESEIDRIYADMELEKASQNMAIDKATADWESNARVNAQTNAQTTATAIHEANTKAETEATKMALEQQKNRGNMAQDLIMDGVKNSEAWAAAYKAYPDYTTVEGVQYAQYAQLREQGYPVAYANVASQAYATAIGAGGTDEQAEEAASDALAEQAHKVAQKYGADRDTPAWSNDAAGVKRALSETMQLIKGIKMPDEERMEVVAYLLGTAYSYRVVKSPNNPKLYQQIGEALEANLSGIYLEIALACAGLK